MAPAPLQRTRQAAYSRSGTLFPSTAATARDIDSYGSPAREMTAQRSLRDRPAHDNCLVAAHLLRRTYMIAAPPGMMVTATGYGRSASWLVTVRPAMMPTAEPNTASLSQWRFAGRRERATYDEKTYAGIEYLQCRCRSSAVAKANVSAAWPEGNEFLLL